MSGSTSSIAPIPQRIVHVTFGLDLGGLERLLLEIADKTLPERQQLFFVSLGTMGIVATEIRKLGWPVVCLHRPTGVCPSLLFSLARIFLGVRPDVVHTHDARALIYAAPAARLMRVKRVIHTQHGQNLGMTPRRLKLLRFAAKMTDHFVCVSRDARRIAAEQGISDDRLRVVYNGIDVDRMRSASNPRRDNCERDTLVTISRLSPEKDVSTLLKAIALVSDSIPEVRLEIAGDGPCHAELLREAKELDLSHRVRFLGNVSDPARVLSRARIFVLSSISEGISLTLLESMSAGVPAIATRVGGTPEVIQHGRTGLLVPPRDPQALADAIQQLWFDDALQFQLTAAAQDRVAEHFHVRRMVAQYQQLYSGSSSELDSIENLDGTPAQHPVAT